MFFTRMLSLTVLVLVVFCFLSFARADVQQPLARTGPESESEGYIFSEAFNASSTQDGIGGYRILVHDAFPNHSVRMRLVPGFCDPTVRAFTGYIDVEARHLFFYYFESRRNPAEDDVILWLNGGPGGSSAMGLFMELGPCNIASGNSTQVNPWGWNSNANLLFVEQPIGVGFSYADYGETVTSTPEAAKDIAAFLAIFFESVDGLKGRALHIAGESFAGRYIPLSAAEVYDQNKKLEKWNMTPVNLTSIMIGNGLSHQKYMMASYYNIQCTDASGSPPIQSISVCTRMKQAIPRCEAMVTRYCEDMFDEMNCRHAMSFCANELFSPLELTGKSFYDIRTECIGENVQDMLCYAETRLITEYLNLPSTRRLLNIDTSFDSSNWTIASWDVNMAFDATGDVLQSSDKHIEALLERGVKVLIYTGTYDLTCNWVGNERMTMALEWYGRDGFVRTGLRDWYLDGNTSIDNADVNVKPAGKTKSFEGLTFATVYDSGHMVPYDRPQEALALINRWLAGMPL